MTGALRAAREFDKDFQELMLSVRAMALKHDLAVPALLFHPEWRSPIAQMVDEHLIKHDPQSIPQRSFAGVRFEFGIMRAGLNIS